MQKLGFLSKNHGSQECLPCCSRVSLTAASAVPISRRGRGQRPRLQYQPRLHQSRITSHRSLGSHGLGLGCGVGRTLGIGLPLGVGVGRGVEVAVAVGVGVGVAHGVSMYVRDWFCGGESGQQMQKSSV